MTQVEGYKAFNKDLTNRYGVSFVVGNTYTIEGPIKFGNNGNGFHMCKNLSDVFRYFPSELGEIVVAQVTGTGSITTFDDDYNGYYDMYAVETITINSLLTREDILTIMLKDHIYNNQKFITTYQLNDEELFTYLQKYQNSKEMLAYLLYYQKGIKDAFKRSLKDLQDMAQKMIFAYQKEIAKQDREMKKTVTTTSVTVELAAQNETIYTNPSQEKENEDKTHTKTKELKEGVKLWTK